MCWRGSEIDQVEHGRVVVVVVVGDRGLSVTGVKSRADYVYVGDYEGISWGFREWQHGNVAVFYMRNGEQGVFISGGFLLGDYYISLLRDYTLFVIPYKAPKSKLKFIQASHDEGDVLAIRTYKLAALDIKENVFICLLGVLGLVMWNDHMLARVKHGDLDALFNPLIYESLIIIIIMYP